MPYIQYRDQRVPLGNADLSVGAYDGATLRLPGDEPLARAVLTVGADGTGVIRRGREDSLVLVNGVQLGAEPSPLLHGDKIDLGGVQLHYGDDAKGGSTQFISAASLADAVRSAGSPKKPTTAKGGRLVSLVDGREYAVPGAGVTFGREIGNDIVVASTEVSRRHAQIAPAEGGYVLTDLSTNGVLVNGVRVSQRQVLGRGDVVRIGPEEFRFYADVIKPAAAPAQAAPSAPPPAPPTPVDVPRPAPAPAPPPPLVIQGAMEAPDIAPISPSAPTLPPPSHRPMDFDVVAGAPPPPPAPKPAPPKPPPAPAVPAAATAAPTREPLATLDVINEGPMKGRKFELYTPLTNVGRGQHNDVVISDESVSDSHAKILRREGAWWLVDQGSTNGSYVGGRRVQGEQQLTGAPDVRFGGIKMTFRASATAADEGGGTRAIAAFGVEQAKRLSQHRQSAAAAAAATVPSKAIPLAPAKASPPAPAPEPQVPEKKKGCAAVIAFLAALGALASLGATTLVFLALARG